MDKEQTSIQEPPDDKKREGWVYRLGRWVARFFFAFFMLSILLSILVQIPSVQTKIARFATAKISDYLGVNVSIQRVGIVFFDRVVLEGFYVEDPECDTLFIAEKVVADINTNIFKLLWSGLEIEELSLTKASLNVYRAQGAQRSNLQWLLDQFIKREKEEKKKPFQVRLKRLYLEEVNYTSFDDVKGSSLRVRVPQGIVRVSKMNLPGKILLVDQVVLDRPELHLESRIEHPLPQALSIALRQPSPPKSDTTTWTLALKEMDITGGVFSTHNLRKAPVKETPEDVLDFNHLEVFGIGIKMTGLDMTDGLMRGVIDKITARTGSGFYLQQLSAKEALVSSKSIVLNGLDLQTPESRLGDTLAFSFEHFDAFADFNSSVGMDVRFQKSFVAVRDIMTFAPELEKNPFFQNNRDETVQIQGRVRGTINDLSGRNLEIELGRGAFLRGRLDLKDITIPGQGYFGVSLQEARTSMRVLEQIIPKFNLPDNFDRLGNVQFRGDINGFFATGFTIFGLLRSDLGIADLDMTLNPNGGKEKATYSGSLSLQDFDLGEWTQNPDFGKVSLSASVQKGRSLEAATAGAELTAKLRSFTFKGYEYKNANLAGSLNRKLFQGDFDIQDENVDFTFNGRLDFSQAVPVFNFKAALKKIDLKELNLSKKDIIIAGNMDLNIRDNKIATAEGEAFVTDLQITLNQDETFSVDRLEIESKFSGDSGEKTFRVDSDIVEAFITGRFEIDQLPAILLNHLHRNYTVFADRLGIKPSTRRLDPAVFTFRVDVKDSKGFNHLLSPQLYPIKNSTLSGRFDEPADMLRMELKMPFFQYGDLRLEEPDFIWDTQGGIAEYSIGIDYVLLKDKQLLSTPLMITGLLRRDSLEFALTYLAKGITPLENLTLNGMLTASDSSAINLHFDQSNLTLMNRLWLINQDNQITFFKDSIKISNLVLTHQDYRIGIESSGRKGLRLAMINFDFDFIEKHWEYEPLNFSGRFAVNARVDDVFKMEGLQLSIIADTLLINNDDWGTFYFTAQAQNLKGRIDGAFNLENDSTQLSGEGFFNLQDIKGRGLTRALAQNLKNYFSADFTLSGVPLRTVEYFLPDVLTDTKGRVNGELNLRGGSGGPYVQGLLHIRDAAVSIDFLKTTYNIDYALVKMNNDWLFDASGISIRDKFGHTAAITGGIRHSKLKDLRIDATVITPRLLALDTKKGDNKQFYGQAIGSGYVSFRGPLEQINAYIKGEVNDSTRLVIPISAEKDARAVNYVKFVDRRAQVKESAAPLLFTPPKGMNVEMDLTVGRESVMQLIIDEQAGDIVEGTGRGNIRILLPQNGEFQMFGDYTIEEGDYLFTLFNVINKKFRVQRGGSIRWSGDPYKAIIKLDAEYKGISAPVAGLIADLIVGERQQIKTEAAKSTAVNLILHLAGELFQPQINFDIEFPLLTGELKNYTDTKLRILKQDPNELNRQAFGLIVAGQFLPSDLNVQSVDVIYNTVSEFVSNQLSLLLTGLFSEFIADGRVLSGLDFDVAYSQYRPGTEVGGNNPGRGEEYEVRLRQNYFNDRLSVIVGGNLNRGGSLASNPSANSGTFLGNDVVIEYAISADRSLTLKVYQRLQPDIGGRRRKVGAGLSFRKEYDSFGDFLRSIGGNGKKKKEEEKPEG